MIRVLFILLMDALLVGAVLYGLYKLVKILSESNTLREGLADVRSRIKKAIISTVLKK